LITKVSFADPAVFTRQAFEIASEPCHSSGREHTFRRPLARFEELAQGQYRSGIPETTLPWGVILEEVAQPSCYVLRISVSDKVGVEGHDVRIAQLKVLS
jgi:hypothetical protein